LNPKVASPGRGRLAPSGQELRDVNYGSVYPAALPFLITCPMKSLMPQANPIRGQGFAHRSSHHSSRMNPKSLPRLAAIAAMTCTCLLASGLLLVSCGSGSSSCVGATPVPKLSAVSPNSISSQALPASLTLKGSGFVSWSTVYLNSANLSSTTLNSGRILAGVSSQDLSAAGVTTGTVYISVTNAGQVNLNLFDCPNGGSSRTIPITIE